MSVYAIALINISDRAGYAVYEQGFMDIFNRFKGRLLAVDENPAEPSLRPAPAAAPGAGRVPRPAVHRPARSACH